MLSVHKLNTRKNVAVFWFASFVWFGQFVVKHFSTIFILYVFFFYAFEQLESK